MYRFFLIRNIQCQKIFEVTCSPKYQNSNYYSLPQSSCPLCNITNNYSKVHGRNQSSFTNPLTNAKKVRKKRNKTVKHYTELLVVTNSSTTQQKTPLHNLTSRNFDILTTKNFNLNLPKLYNLKNPSKDNSFIEEHTYNNLTIINSGTEASDTSNIFLWDQNILSNIDRSRVNLPNNGSLLEVVPELTGGSIIPSDFLLQNNFVEPVPHTETDLLDNLSSISTFQPAIINDEHTEIHDESEEIKYEMEEAKSEPLEKIKPVKKTKTLPNIDSRQKKEILHKSLASYIEMCSHMKVPQKGFAALNLYRMKVKKFKDSSKIDDINVYNALIKGFAAKGLTNRVLEIVNIIKEENVALNIQTFISIFESLGRNLENKNVEDFVCQETQKYLIELQKNDLSLNEIFNKGSFLYDQREMVMASINKVNPDFQPVYLPPSLQYKNDLVNSLNHKKQLSYDTINYKENNGLFTPEEMIKLVQKQIVLEKNTYATIKSIEKQGEMTDEISNYRQILEDLYKTWEEAATTAFNRDLRSVTAKRSATNLDIYLKCLPVKEYVNIIMDESKKLAQGSETYSPTVNMLYKDLGSRVYSRYKVLNKHKTGVLDKVIQVHNKYCHDYAATRPLLGVLPTEEEFINSRQRWQWIEHGENHTGATLFMDHQEWVPPALQAVGKFMYHIIMHDLQIDVNSMRSNIKHKNFLPAFYTIFRNQGRIVKEEVKPHPVLSKLYRGSAPETLTFPAYEIPMLCPPIPWISVNTGGYLLLPCDVVRLPSQAVTQKQKLKDADPRDLYPSLDALNQLAAVPWKVNQRVLDVILEVFNSGGSSKLDVPEPPSALKPPAVPTAEMDKLQRYNLFRQKLQHRRKKAEMYSLRCDCLYRLSLANHFRNDIFWLPHNMDFRGRVYPVPPHLNHLGSDLARSMLVFAESRPLGSNGLDWLKIHLINLTGLKKRDPVSERLNFANEKMKLILDSADNPLTGEQWWAESDEPWQTLACCIEIADASRSPDPEKYRSYFPVHQDGSCNGLQHYAALGRDEAGAFSVNLCSSTSPQDVYSAVVVLVEERRKKDAENGVELAKLLEGFVKRKVIKQTIMTTVYGVTRFGARLQIAKQLKDIDSFPKEYVWPASSYLTARTFDSLRTMFTSTKEIQDWFTECARLISSVGGQQVDWITPLGFPIVQPYFRARKVTSTNLFDSYYMDKFEKPNVMKQKNAFPPNFIHSLDSSHMMLTSLNCERTGLTFVSVHDCFWTHASTVNIMNKVCREQFVSLHSQPILEELSLYFSEKFSYQKSSSNERLNPADWNKKKLNKILRQLPKTGDFDINQVLKSVYFFS